MNAKTQSSLSSHLDRHLTSWSVAVLPTLTPRMSISGNLPFSFPSKHGKSAIYCAQTQRKQPNDRISSDAFLKVYTLTLCVPRLKESTAEQLSSLVAQQRLEMDQLRAGHAQDHSSSRVAQLSNRLNTQEVWPGRSTADPDT